MSRPRISGRAGLVGACGRLRRPPRGGGCLSAMAHRLAGSLLLRRRKPDGPDVRPERNRLQLGVRQRPAGHVRERPAHVTRFPMSSMSPFSDCSVQVFPDSALSSTCSTCWPFPRRPCPPLLLRRLRLGRLAALVPAVLYACTSYHFLRCRGHVFLCAVIPRSLDALDRPARLSGPQSVPPGRIGRWAAALAFADVGFGGDGLVVRPDRPGGRLLRLLLLRPPAGGRSGGCTFREQRWATPTASACGRSHRRLAGGGNLALPPVFDARMQPRNRTAHRRLGRGPRCLGVGGEMLLPIMHHRIGFLTHLREQFYAPPRQATGEAWAVSLGALASLGFVWLIAAFSGRARPL